MPLLLQYDSTADENDANEAHGVGASVQIAKNLHAVRATQALSRLCGTSKDGISTPCNETAAIALRSLLTPKLVDLLKNQPPKDLLSNLNANLESPEVFLWFIYFVAMLSLGVQYIPSYLATVYYKA